MSPDDPVVRTYLRHSRVARIATRSARGWPALAPLWFVEQGGRLLTTTGAQALAARNVAADPRVAVLLDAEADGRSAYVLRLHGRATVQPGLPSWRVLAAFARKYYLAPAALSSEWAHAGQWELRRRYYAQSEGVTLEIVPERGELLRRPHALPGIEVDRPSAVPAASARREQHAEQEARSDRHE